MSFQSSSTAFAQALRLEWVHSVEQAVVPGVLVVAIIIGIDPAGPL